LIDAPDAFAATWREDASRPVSHWARLAADRELAMFAAIRDERWLGMAAGRWLDHQQGIVQLWGMWVDPAARRLGLGQRLVGEVGRWARDAGARVLRLGVIDGIEAEAFYQRLGFARTGETKSLRRDDSVTAVFLARSL
jgi:GNAT superfamily N-acetyltransferase